MKIIIYCMLACSLLLMGACWKTDDPPQPQDGALLRIENNSPYSLDKVIIEPGDGGRQEYVAIFSGQLSDYKSFDYIYRYAFIQAIINEDTLTLQPIDYFGEEQFSSGKYTYKIGITTEQSEPGYMIIDFKVD